MSLSSRLLYLLAGGLVVFLGGMLMDALEHHTIAQCTWVLGSMGWVLALLYIDLVADALEGSR